MITRASIVAEAQSWEDTPFHWGQATKSVGCDCKGLVFGVARLVGHPAAEAAEAAFVGYRDRADVGLLSRTLAALFDRSREMRPGDVLQLKVGGRPQHLAIYLGDGRMIHTARGLGRVRDVFMGTPWTEAVHRIWTWRGISG